MEKVRREKMQVREKVCKSRFTVFFPMIWGSGGSKSNLAKAAGAEPAGQRRDCRRPGVRPKFSSAWNRFSLILASLCKKSGITFKPLYDGLACSVHSSAALQIQGCGGFCAAGSHACVWHLCPDAWAQTAPPLGPLVRAEPVEDQIP